jgi:hypothetical protein
LSALVLVGCAGPFARFLADIPTAEFLNDDYTEKVPARIAVLPLENETTDLDAPELIRGLMNTALIRNGYDTLNTTIITAVLREEGISYAGQLNTISIEELEPLLEANALVYGEIYEFKHFITGIYNQRAVATRFELVDLHNGEQLWEDQAEIKKGQTSDDYGSVSLALLSHLARRFLEKATGKPLLAESREAVATHLATLPWGPRKKGYPSWLWTNPGLKVGMSLPYGYPNMIGVQLNAWRKKLGAQVNLSLLARSFNLLYAPTTKGPKKYYVGVRMGHDLNIYDLEQPASPAFSVFVGLEALRWKYARLLPNLSLSMSVGYTFMDNGNPGFLFIINQGFYFN